MADQFTPLIVCGRPRAGTRYVTHVLNKFGTVQLQGEIPLGVMKAMHAFIEGVESDYESAANKGEERWVRQLERWRTNKEALIASCWTYLPKDGSATVRKNLQYYGYKRPGHEHYIQFYERHLTSRKPIYIYCIRAFREHYLSVKSRWPKRPIDKVAKDYLDSIRCYWAAKEICGGRLLTFILDDLEELGFVTMEKRILEPLDLPVDELRRESLQGIGAKNRTCEDLGLRRRYELTDEEADYIAQNSELTTAFEDVRRAMQHDYGVGRA